MAAAAVVVLVDIKAPSDELLTECGVGQDERERERGENSLALCWTVSDCADLCSS